MSEVYSGFQWLYSTLANDATLTSLAVGGIWRGMAPPNTPTPFIVMSLQSGTDTTQMNGYRIVMDGKYLLKVVGPASQTSAIAQAEARLDTLLTQQSGLSGDGSGAILSSYRESPFHLDEIVNGELWANFGGMYRLIIQKLP